MVDTANKVEATLNNDRIVCGACGALLAMKVQGYMCTSKDSAELENKGAVLEIKCKHKDRGIVCNRINVVTL